MLFGPNSVAFEIVSMDGKYEKDSDVKHFTNSVEP